MDIEIIDLQGLSLPQGGTLRRESFVPEQFHDAVFEETFDGRTLIYDCVYNAARGGLLFTGPPLRNLRSVFKAGLRIDGQPARNIKVRNFGRCDQAFFRAPASAHVSFCGAGIDTEIPVRSSEAETFAGKNVLVTKSKNNDPEWILQWCRHHVRCHGANGLILFDNGSTDYTMDALADHLRTVDGLEAVRIVNTPFPFGRKLSYNGQQYRLGYLQIVVLILALTDLASKCRAALHSDIDEMLLTNGPSVFDSAVQSLVGGVMIGGSWVYPAEGSQVPCAQNFHTFRTVPDRKCNRKWCATPGLASRLGGWSTHAFGGGLLRPWRRKREHPDFRLAHCSGTTTGWKSHSARFKSPDNTKYDAVLAEALKLGLPD